MGATVEGRFADWTAAIDFSETPVDGRHGSVEVTIAIPSLTLGTVTQQAMQEEYFDAEDHPTAIYTADLLPGEGEGTYRAEGTLTVKGNSVPLSVPFELDIEGDAARAELSATVDRRDFGIGLGQDSDGTLGFEVGIEARVAATRAEAAS
jgi:polyisoprenoid-binding protein YceI